MFFISFKAAHRGQTMSNINDLTTEQIKELLDLSRRLKEQELRDEAPNHFDLPEEIYDEMENSSKTDLKNKLKKFARESTKFEGGKWTQPGTINKVYLPELKKFQVDAAQTVSAIGKGADRLRTAGRGATEIFLDFQYIIKEGGSQEDMEAVLEKLKRLAVYSLATGKELDQDAKELSTRALRLPESLRYLEDDNDEDKDWYFSPDVVEKIQKTRFDEAMLKGAQRQYGGFQNSRENQFKSSYRGRGGRGNFFGRGRGRGTSSNQQSNDSTTQNINPTSN